MPVTEKVVTKILSALKAAKPIEHKKMFGGVGLYCDGVFFAVIDDDKLYFKTGETNREQFEQAKMPQWIPDVGTGAKMPYHEVPPTVLTDPSKLALWIEGAVAVAIAKKSKKKT